MSFVLDNPVTMCWLLNDGNEGGIAYSAMVLEALKERQAIVPGIWALEVANVIAKIEAKALIAEARTQEFVATLSRMNIVVDKGTASHALGEILNLARRYKLSAYDAAYLELALREGLPLATLDDALEKAGRKAGVKRFAYA
ncbi:MAG: type II toxin-antitoxin system VapC family toxin [Betaproteobacteria bacterium]|nr:type II toxin-antitoxin system VapC family toxin [Betaproteobacteria bacterium]